MPGACAISSMLALRTARAVPKCISSARLRAGPMPGGGGDRPNESLPTPPTPPQPPPSICILCNICASTNTNTDWLTEGGRIIRNLWCIISCIEVIKMHVRLFYGLVHSTVQGKTELAPITRFKWKIKNKQNKKICQKRLQLFPLFSGTYTAKCPLCSPHDRAVSPYRRRWRSCRWAPSRIAVAEDLNWNIKEIKEKRS